MNNYPPDPELSRIVNLCHERDVAKAERDSALQSLDAETKRCGKLRDELMEMSAIVTEFLRRWDQSGFYETGHEELAQRARLALAKEGRAL